MVGLKNWKGKILLCTPILGFLTFSLPLVLWTGTHCLPPWDFLYTVLILGSPTSASDSLPWQYQLLMTSLYQIYTCHGEFLCQSHYQSQYFVQHNRHRTIWPDSWVIEFRLPKNGTNKIEICLFQAPIHSPMNPEKKKLIPYIYNASNKDPF